MTADQIAFAMPEVVQSVVESPTNGPLIAVAAQLWMRPQPARAVQQHSRRAHSFLCIFEVPKRRARKAS